MSLMNRNVMQIMKSPLLFFLLSFSVTYSFSQTTYIPLGDKENDILERLEIKTQDQQLFFSVTKPYSRETAGLEAQMIDSMLHVKADYGNLSKVDKYNLENLLLENEEYTKPISYVKTVNGLQETDTKKMLNAIEVNEKNFFFVANPVIGLSAGAETENNSTLYQAAVGFTARGRLNKAIGFNLYFTYDQDRYPAYINQWVTTHNAVPGQGNFGASFNSNGTLNHVNYIDPRGSITWKITKHINMQAGYDKNFIGDGFYSLFLSDFSASYPFVKIDTKIWKFDFTNLYMGLYTPHTAVDTQLVGLHRYMRADELNINATKWLNAGVYENIVFTRSNFYDISYINPVQFLRPAESNLGSGDNANVGFHAKANVAGKYQFYGQINFDEFLLDNFASNNGWWANKQAYQFGAKYADAFGFKNVDLQLEYDEVRPYTFSHYDSTDNYTHYDQPLAHPLGANFKEFLFIIKAQPIPRVYINLTAKHYFQGLDSAGINFGSNPFEDYDTRPRNYGFRIGDGDRATATIVSANVSYELMDNMFVDLTAGWRTYNVAAVPGQTSYPLQGNVSVINIGFRWNFARTDLTFY
jgi:hypothetical protein